MAVHLGQIICLVKYEGSCRKEFVRNEQIEKWNDLKHQNNSSLTLDVNSIFAIYWINRNV